VVNLNQISYVLLVIDIGKNTKHISTRKKIEQKKACHMVGDLLIFFSALQYHFQSKKFN